MPPSNQAQLKASRVGPAALSHCWSENFHRRHLNSSQAALADEKRFRLDERYAETVKRMEEQARENQKLSKGRGVKGRQLVADLNGDARRTSNKRAKAAGTNRKYLADAAKILDEHPEKAKEIESGEKTITQVNRELKEQAREKRREENRAKVEQVQGF